MYIFSLYFVNLEKYYIQLAQDSAIVNLGEEKYMKTSNNKMKMIATIVIVLMMTSIASIAISLPTAKAAVTNVTGQPGVTAQAATTYPVSSGYPDLGTLPSGVTPAYSFPVQAYISVTPSTMGVGQQALINVWVEPGLYHAFYQGGYTVNIIKPDGTTETLGPVNSYMGDATYWWDYTVDQVGTWQFQFVFPGCYFPATNYTDSVTGAGIFAPPGNQYLLGASVYWEPSTTPWFNVTVQSNAIASWPPAALPGAGDYWSRPVNVMNREWWSIAGNYPWSGDIVYPNGNTLYAGTPNYHYTAYVQAPTSAHVVWMKQEGIAGIIGGEAGYSSVFSSPSTPSVIYDGRCYEVQTEMYNGAPTAMLECFDLRTGQVYWSEPTPTTYASFFGMLFTTYVEPQYITYQLGTGVPVPGATADNGYTMSLVYIGSSLIEWDPFTGTIGLNLTIPSSIISSTFYNDPYVLSVQQLGTPTNPQYYLINWTIEGAASAFGFIAPTNFAQQVISNVTWTPFENLVNSSPGDYTAYDYATGIAVMGGWNCPTPGPQWCIGYHIAAASMTTGTILWNYISNDTSTYNVQAGAMQSLMCHNGVFVMNALNGRWNCWSETTGQLVWTSQSMISNFTGPQPDYPWGSFQAYSQSSYDINDSCSALIACTYAGLFGINWANGDILWHYYDNNTAPFESPYGGNAFFTSCEQADGMIYSYAGEHTPTEPIDRGWDTVCINATTGAEIWHIENTMVPGAVADGYLTAANQDDGYMYVFGMGLTSTTVTAPTSAVTAGTPVLIQGSVMDQSPAQPNTPCVSDASMANQMEYLHMQQSITGLYGDVTMTGVPVVLTATDQSGNVYNIGTTTTSAYDGSYGMSWTPPSPGTYHIAASFYGDDSYGSSDAGTHLLVSAAAATPTSAPTATSAPTSYATTSDLLTYIAVAVIVMIIAIAIVGLLVLRKK
jgi:hypothetical protein